MGWTRCVCLWAALGLVAAGRAHALPPVGEPYPPFSGRAMGTLQAVRLQELVSEHAVTLISFFTTWCKPCETAGLLDHRFSQTMFPCGGQRW